MARKLGTGTLSLIGNPIANVSLHGDNTYICQALNKAGDVIGSPYLMTAEEWKHRLSRDHSVEWTVYADLWEEVTTFPGEESPLYIIHLVNPDPSTGWSPVFVSKSQEAAEFALQLLRYSIMSSDKPADYRGPTFYRLVFERGLDPISKAPYFIASGDTESRPWSNGEFLKATEHECKVRRDARNPQPSAFRQQSSVMMQVDDIRLSAPLWIRALVWIFSFKWLGLS